jgi:hypothetical protein
MNRLYVFLCLISIVSVANSCTQKDDFQLEEPSSYMQLADGKYVTYRLDSLLYVNFGQKDTLIKYQAKDIVEGSITDNLGRKAWRVVRYLRDTAGLTAWQENLTYLVIPTRESLEVVENSLRFIKLTMPLRDGHTWKGNSYVNTSSTDPNWIFRFYDDWNYTCDKTGLDYTPFTTPIANTITINQADEILGTPGNVNAYSERNFAEEVYAKGIGLIYKDLLHWTFQPAVLPTYPNGYYQGFGIRMRMIDHN